MRDGSSSLDLVSTVVERLAVLLAAGVTPTSCWGHLAVNAPAPISGTLKSIDREAGRGTPIADAIVGAVAGRTTADAMAWRALAAAWAVATDAGAPLAVALRDLAESLRSLAQLERDIRVALSGPAATTRLVGALPAIGVLFGVALGFDTIGTLLGTIPGVACLVVGCALLVAGIAWSRRLVSRATPTARAPGLELDLTAIALGGGASIDAARRSVAQALARAGLAAGSIAGSIAVSATDPGASDEATSLDDVLDLSRRAGVPASAMLRGEAGVARRSARELADSRVAKLEVTLMIPLGVCLLPSFMLLGVAPLLISVVSSTAVGF